MYKKVLSVIKLFTLGVLLLISSNRKSYGQFYNKEVKAKILVSNTGDDVLLDFEATATNLSTVNQNLKYVFTVIKKNKSGQVNSKNSQSGRFLLKPSENKNLSKVSLNKEKGKQIILLLLVYNNDKKLLGKDRLVIDGVEKNTALGEKIGEKKIEEFYFRGLVTEETKTKAGRDFYKMFEARYRQQQINGKEIVKIKEVFSLGRNTNLEIYIGHQLIYKFYAKPKEDYLKAVTDQAIFLVAKHFQDLEKLANDIQRY